MGKTLEILVAKPIEAALKKRVVIPSTEHVGSIVEATIRLGIHDKIGSTDIFGFGLCLATLQ